MAEESSRGRIFDAVLALAEELTIVQPALLDEAAAEAAATARYLGERAGEDVLAKGTAGIYALAVAGGPCWPLRKGSQAPHQRGLSWLS